MKKPIYPASIKTWGGRILISVVLFFNLQCALVFIAFPALFVDGFQLSGIPGIAMVQGLGILFLMWNVPYVFAAWNPIRFRDSLIQAIIMQTIGLGGETLLLINLPAGNPNLVNTASRFIVFDGTGLVLLFLAAFLTRLNNHNA